MGLLVTLYLILVNTHGDTIGTAPPLKVMSLLGIWMFGCQMMLFFAVTEYGYLLYMVKFCATDESGEKGCTKENLKAKLAKLDRRCLMCSPIVFFGFNLGYWIWVISLNAGIP